MLKLVLNTNKDSYYKMAPYTSTTIATTLEKTEDQSNGNYWDKNEQTTQHKKVKYFFGEFETELIWFNIISITVLHLYAAYLFMTFPYAGNWKLIVFGLFTGGLTGFGVTGGVHRLYTHRAYKATKALQIICLMCYSSAGQNPVLDWVRDHRVHHKFSETDADPHNSNRGFFFAHVGWLMMKKHPDVLRKGKSIDCSDIINDPLVQFHTRYFKYFILTFCFILPTMIPVLLWQEDLYLSFMVCIARYVISLNSTWSVNSAAHLWGNKPYDRTINPSENWMVSFFAVGEGWHNYHHTFPWDYRAAEMGKFLNVTTLWLNIFASIGLAYDLKTPSPDLVKKVIEKTGDGTHPHHPEEVPDPIKSQ